MKMLFRPHQQTLHVRISYLGRKASTFLHWKRAT